MLLRDTWALVMGKFIPHVSILIRGTRIEGVFRRPIEVAEEKVIDFKGRGLVVPGFIDCHTHLASYGLELSRPNLSHVRSKEEALDYIRSHVENSERGEVIIFEGFDQSKWVREELPTREDLDRVAPLNPIVLRRVCGHMAIANTWALGMLPDNVKGVDPLSGIMYEYVPLNLNNLFPPSHLNLKEGILRAQKRFLEMGITVIHEFGGGRQFRAYQELERGGLLKLTVYFSFYDRHLDSLESLGIIGRFGGKRLRILGVKTFADGSVGAGTAAFSSCYLGTRKRGKLLKPRGELIGLFRRCEELGLTLSVHAIGDRAISQVIETASRSIPKKNPYRHRIEHGEFLNEELLFLLKSSGLFLSMQPNFVERWGKKDGLYMRKLGRRGLRSNPFGSVINFGIPIAFGSDTMPPGPSYGLKGAVNHPVEDERISLEEAIKIYTKGGAYFLFSEDKVGEIRKGREADLLVFLPSNFNITKEPKLFDKPELVLKRGEIVVGTIEALVQKLKD
jgi:hypothetical protein